MRGDSIAILGWSGDAVQLVADNPNIKYRQPEEGFMIFTDSMQIPVGAPHAFTAAEDDGLRLPARDPGGDHGVRQLRAAGEGRAGDPRRRRDPEVAENELIFPDLAKAHNFKTFPPEDEAEIDAAFQRAIGA